jgi:Mu-like prophage major head subunit gpT
MINDDRSGFSSIATRLGINARDEEALQVVALLESNTRAGPTLKDGVTLFHANHANVNGTPGAPDEAHLSAARLAMRKQTDSFGRRIGVVPSVVLVPPDLETTVRKLLSTVQAAQTSNVNAFDDLDLVVESRLTASATRYYAVARNVEGLVIIRLEGRAGPQVETEVDFDSKDLKFSVLHDFGVGFVDYRGWYADGVA